VLSKQKYHGFLDFCTAGRLVEPPFPLDFSSTSWMLFQLVVPFCTFVSGPPRLLLCFRLLLPGASGCGLKASGASGTRAAEAASAAMPNRCHDETW
jgi:hypothetical protein